MRSSVRNRNFRNADDEGKQGGELRYFYDFEFIEDGVTIDVISIGMVAEDGRELYMESGEVNLSLASDWVKQNVIPHLTGAIYTLDEIASAVLLFCNPRLYGLPEFWGYFSAYDHVAL